MPKKRSPNRKKKAKGKKGGVFPNWLKGETEGAVHDWIGKKLRELRGADDLKAIAKLANCAASDLAELEKGKFALKLGSLHEIIEKGYKSSLLEVLEKYFDEHPNAFPDQLKRPFVRPAYYGVRLLGSESVDRATPFFFGGSPGKFVWAVPFRRLAGQTMSTEFIELAPARKKHPSAGATSIDLRGHPGVEIVFVIHGSVDVDIEADPTAADPITRKIRANQCIHLSSRFQHRIVNGAKDNPAFLLVVRSDGGSAT